MLADKVLNIVGLYSSTNSRYGCVKFNFNSSDCTIEDISEIENRLRLFKNCETVFDLKDDVVILNIYCYGDNN